MKSLNIVIVTYNWPPRNAIGTHRPYAWAQHWTKAGALVTVLTAQKQAFDEPLDLHLSELEGVKVFEIAGSGPINLIGKLFKFERLKRLAKKLRSWIRRGGSISIDPRIGWRDQAKQISIKLADNADVVVSTYGPAASHLIGFDMKIANPKLVWVADYRDLWSQSHTVQLSETGRGNMRNLEIETVGKNADLITAVSADMVAKLECLTDRKPLLVPNGFEIDGKQLCERLSDQPRLPEGPLRIVYTGMIYEGHRDPTPLLEALVKLDSENRLKKGSVTIDFYGARVDLVKRLAENRKYAPFIRLMGHVGRDEALSAQVSAGILLLLESPSPEARGVLTGKLFEYMTAGRPILCIGSRPEYEIGSVLKTTGTGVVYGPDEFGRLDKLLLQTLTGKGMFQKYCPNIKEILRFSRERQAKEMLNSIVKASEKKQ